nr:zinc finger, CCHC-type, retrotransposon Gag domain protein [Tanacetum cinerariifolium]
MMSKCSREDVKIFFDDVKVADAEKPIEDYAVDDVANCKMKFLIVAIDYFTKWVEAKPVAAVSLEKSDKNVITAGTEEEQAKNLQWGLRRSTLNHLMYMSYTDVAQVVNAARNYKILHEREDQDSERPDKRQRSGDRHQQTSQQNSHRSHGQNNDRHGSDRRGGNDNHRGSNNNNNYSRIPAMDVTKETGKPSSFEKATVTVDAENWISHMEKIFDVMGCEDAFKTRLAVYKFEGNALAWWKAYKQAKGGDTWLVTVTWADFKKLCLLQFFPRAEQERLKREYHSIRQTIANAARNYEILHERDDQDSERPDKRQRSGDRHQQNSQQSSHRSHGQNNDRHESDRRGGSDNHCSNNDYSGNNKLNFFFKFMQLSSIHEHDPNTTL